MSNGISTTVAFHGGKRMSTGTPLGGSIHIKHASPSRQRRTWIHQAQILHGVRCCSRVLEGSGPADQGVKCLEIQVKDKVVTENFRSQLKNARAKWIEKGRPNPKKAGAKHDADIKELIKEFLCPLYGKNASTSTQKFPLCFLEDQTYEKWMEVFDAWEQGKLIREDGRRPEGCIPKIPLRDITLNDVDRTIGLRDCDMMKLAEAILSKDVSIKSNKLAAEGGNVPIRVHGDQEGAQPILGRQSEAGRSGLGGGKCNVALPLLQELLLPALKKFKCRVINFWGGGNVTALALGEGLEVLEFVHTAEDMHAAYNRVKGMNFIPGGYSISS